VIGVDASTDMIEFARHTFPENQFANLQFRPMDARRLRFNQAFHVVFSSSVLHWVDDHPAFLRGASESLQPGGRLVVSCGGKGNAHDVFLALRPEMRLKQWSGFFRKLKPPYFFHSPEDYRKWLPRFQFKPQRIRLAPKDAVYRNPDAFAAWFRTTWLPYTQRVPEDLRKEFIAGVVDRYLHRHPLRSDGSVHVRMVRLEIDAVKV
jgi:trans-aconitate 2-methyltransferase